MARNKTHYRSSPNSEYSFCQMHMPGWSRSREATTCSRCRKHLGLPELPKAEPKPKPVPTFDFEVTDDVKKALKFVGKTMGAWAVKVENKNGESMSLAVEAATGKQAVDILKGSTRYGSAFQDLKFSLIGEAE